LPWEERRQYPEDGIRTEAEVEVTEDIREWDYGEYEGIISAEIQERRKKAGLLPWDIWRDGCPGGE
jgi:probable phosphoglycerate mutase